jgi:putative phage-type endonuclease
MRTLDHAQGTPEWHAWRADRYTASDAPAMLGISPYKSRAALLREKATGVAQEHDAAALARFAHGHELEAAARPKAEAQLGEDLYPVTGEWEGWTKLAASFDGITMDHSTVWEHKTFNAGFMGGSIPEHVMAQVQQQLLVSGAKRALVTASDASGTAVHTWVGCDEAMIERLIAGWRQFDKDLAAYVPTQAPPPAPQGNAPETLPALRIEITGRVVASNLDDFKARALELTGRIKEHPETDQDFADAETAIKWCKEAEQRLDAALSNALSQTQDVEAVIRAVTEIKETFRKKRLAQEKLVTTRKAEIKESIVFAALQKYRARHDTIQRELGHDMLIPIEPDASIKDAIKGLKTRASCENAVDAALAQLLIKLDADAADLRKKLAWFRDAAQEYTALFMDLRRLAEKPYDDFTLAVTSRIDKAKAEEAARIEKARAEAEAKARAEAEAKAKAKAEAEAKARAEAEAKAKAEAEAKAKAEAEAKAKAEAEAKAKNSPSNAKEAPPVSPTHEAPKPIKGQEMPPKALEMEATTRIVLLTDKYEEIADWLKETAALKEGDPLLKQFQSLAEGMDELDALAIKRTHELCWSDTGERKAFFCRKRGEEAA